MTFKNIAIKNLITAQNIIDTCNSVIDKYHANGELEPTNFSLDASSELIELISKKCLIDTIQWHLEDEVRSPDLSPKEGWAIKKKIDIYNQRRTDTVELIDQKLIVHFSDIKPLENATINSETPGWIIDRLSILCLKLYHMKEQTQRKDVDKNHIVECLSKHYTLEEQQIDLSQAFDQLMNDLSTGKKYMKLYFQMKMYNDKHLNPALYKKN
ncbi:MAG: DUF4254 domain-containing protein [Chitinophagales bacterium]